MKQKTTMVLDLDTGVTYTYMDCKPMQALVSQYLLDTMQVSQLHSKQARDAVKELVTEGRITLNIDNLSVLKENYKLTLKEMKREGKIES